MSWIDEEIERRFARRFPIGYCGYMLGLFGFPLAILGLVFGFIQISLQNVLCGWLIVVPSILVIVVPPILIIISDKREK